ncbi:MAG: CCA tRNA nucleotidyltransferase [Chlamydiia bacterium]|nr:CCA tRNA nucleotidyltransferase [Chlamydiia bacterium]
MNDTQELATSIVRRLKEAGHTAFFAGGWVRDLLMGHPSDDIDIATSASPEEVVALFPRTVQVGIAFGVVVVLLEGHQFEVATFRKDIDYQDGRKPTRIEAADPEQDALRRDFTINGMFYDPLTDTVIDYVGGRRDIEHQMIRTIGHPFERFFEDRLRMIRAVRFACRFGFHIDPETQKAIYGAAQTLFPAVSIERVWQEFVKMSQYPQFDYALVEMHRLGLLPIIFPTLDGVHLTEIKERVAHFHRMPKETPTFAYLLALFPDLSDEAIEDLGRYLKVPRREVKFCLFIRECQRLSNPDSYQWAKIYAHPEALTAFEILAAPLSDEEGRTSLLAHQERMQALAPHIRRAQEKKTLLTSEHLKEAGIKPGKEMGDLLREGEKLTVEYNLECPKEVLKKLREKWRSAP